MAVAKETVLSLEQNVFITVFLGSVREEKTLRNVKRMGHGVKQLLNVWVSDGRKKKKNSVCSGVRFCKFPNFSSVYLFIFGESKSNCGYTDLLLYFTSVITITNNNGYWLQGKSPHNPRGFNCNVTFL